MEKIEHSTITTNGINMHVVSIGTGPVVLFLHGFPELWYSWRHQMISLSSLGYRCIAPDLRGYGDTDVPPSPASYTALHVVGDVVGLLDHLGVDQVFLVGHDWGAVMAWYFCLFRPERVKALVNLSVPFISRNREVKIFDEGLRAFVGDDFYIFRFQEEDIEKELASVDNAKVLKIFHTSVDSTPLRVLKGGLRRFKVIYPLPSWLLEEYIKSCVCKFSQKGFTR